jgi:hypothetical protein
MFLTAQQKPMDALNTGGKSSLIVIRKNVGGKGFFGIAQTGTICERFSLSNAGIYIYLQSPYMNTLCTLWSLWKAQVWP